MLKTALIDREIHYSGAELRPHFILSEFRIQGSTIIAFRGSCEVKTDDLVDWEDRLVQDSIVARQMLHFIGEFFGPSLREAVFFQRLFMATVGEVLREVYQIEVIRKGDDLWVKDRKLSVSIASASAVSQMVHVGINIDPEGAPVPAIGLKELKIDFEKFALEILNRIQAEYHSVEDACTKVRPLA